MYVVHSHSLKLLCMLNLHQVTPALRYIPRLSHVGSSGHQITPIVRDVPGLSWDVPFEILRTPSRPILRDVPGLSWNFSNVESSGHQVTPILRDIPGLSWNVPCGILRTPSHTNIERRPRTVLGCPIWDPPDTKLHQFSGTSQDCLGMSHVVGSSRHQMTIA